MTVEMNPVLPYSNAGNKKAWEYSEERTSPGDGAWVLFPQDCNQVVVILEVQRRRGRGRIELTISPLNEIETNPVIIEWEHGNTRNTRMSVVAPVSAIRAVNMNGVQRLAMRAQ